MEMLRIAAIAAAIAFVLAILIATAPAFAGPSASKCHSHGTHQHCH